MASKLSLLHRTLSFRTGPPPQTSPSASSPLVTTTSISPASTTTSISNSMNGSQLTIPLSTLSSVRELRTMHDSESPVAIVPPVSSLSPEAKSISKYWYFWSPTPCACFGCKARSSGKSGGLGGALCRKHEGMLRGSVASMYWEWVWERGEEYF
ncbi:hypothetical protein BDV95DRAFT_149458 [Massariosphaeria phaeospora]|uniref:Uncharacterized protein n=1 Tax=Massariosphaeria phaeospora TaxID=100035 RepID=A0A7C8MUS2_9PLEO|nr:hypothetical protein BDV95DRAFT_149458 [Massariosphaeria phaeospora]